MRTAAPARLESLAFATLVAVRFKAGADLRLRPGDERGQSIDTTIADRNRLRLGLRLILRLRTMVAMLIVARVVLLARLIRLPFALLIARHKRLRLGRSEARLLAEMRKTIAFVFTIVG